MQFFQIFPKVNYKASFPYTKYKAFFAIVKEIVHITTLPGSLRWRSRKTVCGSSD